jgi:Cys-tRNA(Pro) deacylase
VRELFGLRLLTLAGKLPVTAAIRWLRSHHIDFQPQQYRYEAGGGTRVSARELGVDEHSVIKTLVMETDLGDPLVILMHGDQKVSTKNLARTLGVRKVVPCKPAVADRHSGYTVGGTSPFGLKRQMPIYVEASILELERIAINGGGRGFLVQLNPMILVDPLGAQTVEVAVAASFATLRSRVRPLPKPL